MCGVCEPNQAANQMSGGGGGLLGQAVHLHEI